jgi:tRNA U34 5-carboxymethylaminomethyl modifying enzyme MnmG/GidA
MEWNGMEWNGMEWNGMEWNGIKPNTIFRFSVVFGVSTNDITLLIFKIEKKVSKSLIDS